MSGVKFVSRRCRRGRNQSRLYFVKVVVFQGTLSYWDLALEVMGLSRDLERVGPPGFRLERYDGKTLD